MADKKKEADKEDYETYQSAKYGLFTSEFSKESDRAAVILSAAMLDNALASLLKTNLAPINSSNDTLFDGANAPLSDFSSRIDMTNRLGLISNRFCRDLHLIRKIRNGFAHNIEGCSFEQSDVKSRILELVKSSNYLKYNEETRKIYPLGPRGDFQHTVSFMLWIIHDRIDDTESVNEAELEWAYLQKEYRDEEEAEAIEKGDAEEEAERPPKKEADKTPKPTSPPISDSHE